MSASSHRSPLHRGAFTIIELLVVVAIISVLVGLLLPALAGVKRKAAKTSELNSIKQIGHAWMLYGNNNNDAALPGYLDAPVQAAPVQGVSRGWGVTYQYPDRTDIPNNPVNLPGPWTWRLLSYLDYNHEMVHGYRDEDNADRFTMITEAQAIAEEPGFGYNGYYIGGYWQMQSVDGIQSPQFKFYDHCGVINHVRISIPTTIAQIKRSSEVITFCSSAKLDPNGGYYSSVKVRSDLPGAHLVAPPIVGTTPQWQPYPQDPLNAVEVLAAGAYVPLGRFTGPCAVLYADGHCDPQSVNALYDQRKWIDNASGTNITEARFYKHDVCPP